MSAPPTEPEGILLVDKPAGFTSHDLVAWMRRKLNMKRVGHAGTLDPMATGLMLLLIGRATKASQFLLGLDKVYEGTFELGRTTDSHDAEGETMMRSPVPPLTAAELQEHMEAFLGDQMQTPPMFSAIKKGGVPLYKLARKGEEVEREDRFIRLTRFRLLGWEPPHGRFELACSKGTYVRTVVHDLGQRIDCGATLTALRRTAIDRFTLAQALALPAIEALPGPELVKRFLPMREVVPLHGG